MLRWPPHIECCVTCLLSGGTAVSCASRYQALGLCSAGLVCMQDTFRTWIGCVGPVASQMAVSLT